MKRNTFRVLGKNVETCDATLQVYTNNEWQDYFSIKDRNDAVEAERLQKQPDFRIIFSGAYFKHCSTKFSALAIWF